MTQTSQKGTSTAPHAPGVSSHFSTEMAELGWFSSLLMGTAAGFAAFFAATFFGIIGILIYNSVTHHAVDFAVSYRLIGLPIGLVVIVTALGCLGFLWVRRHIRRK